MRAERITVEMGGFRKRCTMLGRPTWSEEGGLVARARYAGQEFEIVDVRGVWLTRSAWEYVKSVLDRSN